MANNLVDSTNYGFVEGLTAADAQQVIDRSNAAYTAVSSLEERIAALEETSRAFGVRIGEHGLAIYQLQQQVDQLVATMASGGWEELYSGTASSGIVTLSESLENFSDLVFVDERNDIAIVHVGDQGQAALAADPWSTIAVGRRTGINLQSYWKNASYAYGYWYVSFVIIHATDSTSLEIESIKAGRMGVGGNVGSGTWIVDSSATGFAITHIYGANRIAAAE